MDWQTPGRIEVVDREPARGAPPPRGPPRGTPPDTAPSLAFFGLMPLRPDGAPTAPVGRPPPPATGRPLPRVSGRPSSVSRELPFAWGHSLLFAKSSKSEYLDSFSEKPFDDFAALECCICGRPFPSLVVGTPDPRVPLLRAPPLTTAVGCRRPLLHPPHTPVGCGAATGAPSRFANSLTLAVELLVPPLVSSEGEDRLLVILVCIHRSALEASVSRSMPPPVGVGVCGDAGPPTPILLPDER